MLHKVNHLNDVTLHRYNKKYQLIYNKIKILHKKYYTEYKENKLQCAYNLFFFENNYDYSTPLQFDL